MELKRKQPIGVELVKRGIVTENDIEKALEEKNTDYAFYDEPYIKEILNRIK